VATWYLDTSAALKLILAEAESAALANLLDKATPDLSACRLLETEMRRAAHRNLDLHQDQVTAFLEGIDLYELPASLFRQAGLLPGPHLRSLDALHLATAIALDVDALVTYNARLSEACIGAGLAVIQPR
jgi:uncharacterized protein